MAIFIVALKPHTTIGKLHLKGGEVFYTHENPTICFHRNANQIWKTNYTMWSNSNNHAIFVL